MAIPPEAQKRTEAGAKAFARFFWESASQSLVTNDPSLVMDLSAPQCKQCKVFEHIAVGERRRGQHLSRPTYNIKIVRIVRGTSAHYVVSVAGNEVVVDTLDDRGRLIEKTKPGIFSWATKVAWAGRWFVVGFEAE